MSLRGSDSDRGNLPGCSNDTEKPSINGINRYPVPGDRHVGALPLLAMTVVVVRFRDFIRASKRMNTVRLYVPKTQNNPKN